MSQNVIEDLAVYIEDNEPDVDSAFLSHMPEGASPTVAIFEYSGLAPGRSMGSNIVSRNPRVQVQVRHDDYAAARELAMSIYELLIAISDQDINGNRYIDVEAQSEPELMYIDQTGRVIIVSNYQVSYPHQ